MTTHVDVLIVGGGLSGICQAYYLRKLCPGKSFVILESRDTIGGTWSLFSYPGIRSDSDIITFSFSFKEWDYAQSLATGPAILEYLQRTADEFHITEKIRFGHRVEKLSWDSAEAKWTADVTVKGASEPVSFSANYVVAAAGYYSYENPYLPTWEGQESFKGTIAVPQFWPKDLDYKDKRVAVIGSGATAMTMVPAMADEGAGHVTMIQRSPTYTFNVPRLDPWAKFLRGWLPLWMANRILWAKNLFMGWYIYRLASTKPDMLRKFIISETKKQLPEGYDVKKHFNPKYDPWRQRLCAVSDGDLYKSIASGKTSIETDEIERLTEDGVLLKSGKLVEADIIVPATGLTMNLLNGFGIFVDGKKINTGDCIAWKSVLLSGLPNFTAIFGYINSSWTLKAELISKWICRMLTYMDSHGYSTVEAVPPPNLNPVQFPYMDSNYFMRAIHLFPKEGDKEPWKLDQNYFKDVKKLWWDSIESPELKFGKAGKERMNGHGNGHVAVPTSSL